MKNQLPYYQLRELCIEKQWFTCGTCQQYDRLFQKASEGASIKELSLIIWLCSYNGLEQEEVEKVLLRAQKKYLSNKQVSSEL